MIEAVMDYFQGVINTVDSDLQYDGLVFGNDLTADHNLDYTYKMVLGTMLVDRQDTDITSKLPVTIKIYKVSNIDKQVQDFVGTYCKAIDISALAMNQTNIDQVDYIKSVESKNIQPKPLIDNDNTLEFTLEFNVIVTYKYITN